MPSARRVARDGLTTGKRWRDRRNALIFVAAAAGFSIRLLSDIFDLSRSRIRAIVLEVRAKTARAKNRESPFLHAAKRALALLKSASPELIYSTEVRCPHSAF